MERILKILLIIVLGIFAPVFADTPVAQNVQKAQQADCVKTFPVSFDKLFYLTLAGMNEYNYKIKEIQSKGGYIVFETKNKQFLATTVYVSSAKAMLKITPYGGNYDFELIIPQNLFNYIEKYQAQNF